MQPTLTKQVSPQVHNHCGLGVSTVGLGVLVGLGLTGRQARVYLALLKTGDAKAKAIASFSQVHRQEVYRLIDSLQQLGLVQRNITVPTTFMATPIGEGVKLLLEQKTSELSVMCQNAKKLTKKLSQNGSFTPLAIDLKPCFGTVFEADRGKKYRRAIQETQQSIEAATSWNRFKQLSIHYETQLQNALRKGTAIRIVTDKPPNHHLPKWIKASLSKNSNFKLKIQPNMPDAAITIFDQKNVAIAYNPNTSLTKGPDLWTNNPTLTAMSQAYFNAVWVKTKTSPKKPSRIGITNT